MLDYLGIIIGMMVVAYFAIKNRKQVQQLSLRQLIGVLLSFVVTVAIAFICIYYGGNWLADQFTNSFVQSFIFISIIVVTLGICINALRKVVVYIVR